MPARRPASRIAAWIALAAILLSTLPPALAHGDGVTAGFDRHSDFCSTAGTKDSSPSLPLPADHERKVCTHCDGCTTNAGSAWATPPASARTVALNAKPTAIAIAALPTPAVVDVIAAPPRGPPRLA